MKARKGRLTALLTALVTAAALFPMTLTASAYQGEDGAEYEATLDHTALTAVIDGIEYGTTVPSEMKIPKTLSEYGRTYAVIAIGPNAFQNKAEITSVVIPDGVEVIDSMAFYSCTGLKSVTIPDSVTSIGQSAFAKCATLEKAAIGSDSATKEATIGVSAFSGCSALKEVTLGNNVTEIGSSAFYRCSSLESITIPKSVTGMGTGILSGCTGLKSVTLKNQMTEIPKSMFSNLTQLERVTLPESVTTIGERAFAGCYLLGEVNIPAAVTSIGDHAFENCYQRLEAITIPKNVISIGEQAFFGCMSLKSITVDKDNPVFSSVDGVLMDKTETVLKKYPGAKSEQYRIPDSVTSLAIYAFDNCLNLKSVEIPKSVKEIGSAFIASKELADIYYAGTKPEWNDPAVISKGPYWNYLTQFAAGGPGRMHYGLAVTLHYGSETGQTQGYTDALLSVPQITPPDGYTVGGWFRDSEFTDPWDFSKDMADEDTAELELYARLDEIVEYKVVSGDGQQWTKESTEPLKITFKSTWHDDKAFGRFESAAVDGKALKDGEDFEKAEGSVIISLRPGALNLLPDGDHTLEVRFTDGGSATARFKVLPAKENSEESEGSSEESEEESKEEPSEESKEEPSEESKEESSEGSEESGEKSEGDSPKTGDGSKAVPWCAAAVLSLAAAAFAGMRRKENKEDR